MPWANSIDLRKRAVGTYLAGEGTYEQIAKRFEIGEATLNRWLRRKRETGDVKPLPHRNGRRGKVDLEGLAELRRLVEEQPDATLVELSERYEKSRGVKLALSIVCRALQKLNLSRKKRQSMRRNSSAKMCV